MRLNEGVIRRLAIPAKGNVITYDDAVPGFGVCVTANNSRAFVLAYSIDGRQRRMTIGSWPAWTVTAARDRARQLRRTIDQGEDPLGVRNERRSAPTFKEVAEEYLERHAARKKSGHVDEAMLRRDVLPAWASLKAGDIRRRDVIRLLESKAEDAPIAANRLLALVRKLFNWAISRDLVEANPCVQVKAPGVERQRDRVLSADEIRAFWKQLDNSRTSAEVRTVLRLILITAQRPGEVCAMEWDELDLSGNWWTVPAGKAKNGLAHRVPLTAIAWEYVNARTRESQWVFPSPRGDKPIRVAALSHAVRLNHDCFEIAHFTPHDLRRTAASHMSAGGVSRLVVKKILNHVETGVTSVYDRYGYDQEKRDAEERWERALRQILADEKAPSWRSGAGAVEPRGGVR